MPCAALPIDLCLLSHVESIPNSVPWHVIEDRSLPDIGLDEMIVVVSISKCGAESAIGCPFGCKFENARKTVSSNF